jgi:hypothetical protein
MKEASPQPGVDRRDRLELVVRGSAAVLIGLTLFVAGVWVGSAGGGSASPEPTAGSRAVPDWFAPIWDVYDRDPSVTPAFDFARLYDSRPGAYARLLRPSPSTGP